MSLNRRCAIVTGGASGIGKQLTIKLVTSGVDVVFGDINQTDGIKLQEDIIKNQPQASRAIFKLCDVRKLVDLQDLFSTATEQFGGAQILVNNAGVFPKEDIEHTTDFIHSIIDINLKATYIGTSLAIQHFRKQKEEPKNLNRKDFCIINLSSVSACTYFPTRSVYSSCKAGILHFSKNLVYLQSQNIRVNCVLPYITDTPMIRKAMGEELALKQAIEKSGAVIPPMWVVEGILELINNDKYAGEALSVGQDGFTFLPKL